VAIDVVAVVLAFLLHLYPDFDSLENGAVVAAENVLDGLNCALDRNEHDWVRAVNGILEEATTEEVVSTAQEEVQLVFTLFLHEKPSKNFALPNVLEFWVEEVEEEVYLDAFAGFRAHSHPFDLFVHLVHVEPVEEADCEVWKALPPSLPIPVVVELRVENGPHTKEEIAADAPRADILQFEGNAFFVML